MSEILIIPDVHGRRFWREAVERYPQADTIFLGDYHDPYPQEGISEDESLENFRELVGYARAHPNCHLLLGNHDLHYLCDFGEACRQDFENSAAIVSLLKDNLDLFSIATLRDLGGKKVVFSHAPILRDWIEMVGETENVALLVNRLNRLLTTIVDKPWETEDMLGYISEYRGGYESVGSPVWADVREIDSHSLIPTADYSIFGHTQLRMASITAKWADLDSRKAYLIDEELDIWPAVMI